MRTLLEQFGVHIAVSAVLHIGLGLFLVISLDRSAPIAPPAAQPEPIEATVVDEELIETELERIRETERQREQALEDARREAEELAARRAEEERRLQALREEQAQEQRDREARARAEQERVAELERQRREEEARLAEQARQREAEEARRREAEEARQREAEAERRRQAEAEQAQREEAARQAARLEAQARYIADIRHAVERSWLRPADWPAGAECTVRVSQIPGGEVVQVRITRSCGNAVLDRSVENAVLRASPLPRPSDPEVFSREIEFVFRPVDR